MSVSKVGIGKQRVKGSRLDGKILAEGLEPQVFETPEPDLLEKYDHAINQADFKDFPISEFKRPAEVKAMKLARKKLQRQKVMQFKFGKKHFLEREGVERNCTWKV